MDSTLTVGLSSLRSVPSTKRNVLALLQRKCSVQRPLLAAVHRTEHKRSIAALVAVDVKVLLVVASNPVAVQRLGRAAHCPAHFALSAAQQPPRRMPPHSSCATVFQTARRLQRPPRHLQSAEDASLLKAHRCQRRLIAQ
eukprot:5153603-Pyramimonas_sp.AAC.1